MDPITMLAAATLVASIGQGLMGQSAAKKAAKKQAKKDAYDQLLAAAAGQGGIPSSTREQATPQVDYAGALGQFGGTVVSQQQDAKRDAMQQAIFDQRAKESTANQNYHDQSLAIQASQTRDAQMNASRGHELDLARLELQRNPPVAPPQELSIIDLLRGRASVAPSGGNESVSDQYMRKQLGLPSTAPADTGALDLQQQIDELIRKELLKRGGGKAGSGAGGLDLSGINLQGIL